MTVIPCYNNARGSKGNVCSLPNRVYFKSSKKSLGFLEFYLDVSDFFGFFGFLQVKTSGKISGFFWIVSDFCR